MIHPTDNNDDGWIEQLRAVELGFKNLGFRFLKTFKPQMSKVYL